MSTWVKEAEQDRAEWQRQFDSATPAQREEMLAPQRLREQRERAPFTKEALDEVERGLRELKSEGQDDPESWEALKELRELYNEDGTLR
jgi:hypothetical protein